MFLYPKSSMLWSIMISLMHQVRFGKLLFGVSLAIPSRMKINHPSEKSSEQHLSSKLLRVT